jgi:hypothetical protein
MYVAVRNVACPHITKVTKKPGLIYQIDPPQIDAFLSKFGCDAIDGASLSGAEDWRGYDGFGAPSFYIPDEATEWESFDPSISREEELKKDPAMVFHQVSISAQKFSFFAVVAITFPNQASHMYSVDETRQMWHFILPMPGAENHNQS